MLNVTFELLSMQKANTYEKIKSEDVLPHSKPNIHEPNTHKQHLAYVFIF